MMNQEIRDRVLNKMLKARWIADLHIDGRGPESKCEKLTVDIKFTDVGRNKLLVLYSILEELQLESTYFVGELQCLQEICLYCKSQSDNTGK
jgi:hypothetical protein